MTGKLAMSLSKQSNKIVNRIQIVIVLTLLVTLGFGIYAFTSEASSNDRDLLIGTASLFLVLLYFFITITGFVIGLPRIRGLNKPKIMKVREGWAEGWRTLNPPAL